MQYKTICLQLIQERPEAYDRLLKSRTLLAELDRSARQLRDSHLEWKEWLSEARPDSSESQVAAEALEIALKELEASLPPACPQDDPLCLDAAMASLHRHTPPA